jgi:hypothetical protein
VFFVLCIILIVIGFIISTLIPSRFLFFLNLLYIAHLVVLHYIEVFRPSNREYFLVPFILILLTDALALRQLVRKIRKFFR